MKASRGIDKTAEVTGILRATVFGVARSLREAKPKFWPEGGKGRNQAADIEPPHAFNLGLGLALAEPITEVPGRVSIYRSLEVDGEWMPRDRRGIAALLEPVDRPEWITGGTLASNIEWAIDRLANDPVWRSQMKKANLCLVLKTGSLYSTAWIETNDWQLDFSYYKQDLAPLPMAPILTQKTIPFALLATFADIWADTLAERAKRTVRDPGGATGNARSAKKKAGTPARAPASSDSMPYDDTHADTDTTRKVIGPHNLDDNACVCLSSSGVGSPLGTRNRHHDAYCTPHFHSLR